MIIRLEDERVDQPDHKQEDGPPDGHRCCPVDVLETGEPQADPGQHHECCGGAAFKRADEYAQWRRPAAAVLVPAALPPAPVTTLKFTMTMPAKARNRARSRPSRRVERGMSGVDALVKVLSANLSLSNWILRCASVVSNRHNAFPMKSVARLVVKPDASVGIQNFFILQLWFPTPNLAARQCRCYLKGSSCECEVRSGECG